jgi:hypothetical protein
MIKVYAPNNLSNDKTYQKLKVIAAESWLHMQINNPDLEREAIKVCGGRKTIW